MITISQAINELIGRKPFLSEALAEGLINISSLARKLQPEVEARLHKKVQSGAIVMALNRFMPQTDLIASIRMRKLFENMGDIIVRSSLSDITFRNSDTLFENQHRISRLVVKQRETFYTFVQGVFESTIVASTTLAADIFEIMKNETLLNSSHGLSSITLKLPIENMQESGLYYFILRHIAWEGINLVEVISTSNEFTLVVKAQDVDKAFSVLNKMRKL